MAKCSNYKQEIVNLHMYWIIHSPNLILPICKEMLRDTFQVYTKFLKLIIQTYSTSSNVVIGVNIMHNENL